MTSFRERQPQGIPTGGQFATTPRQEAPMSLMTEKVVVLDHAGEPRTVDFRLDVPLENRAIVRNHVAGLVDRPDLVNLLAERLVDAPDDEWEGPAITRGEYRTMADNLVANPCLSDENFVSLVEKHAAAFQHLGSPVIDPFHRAALTGVAGRGEAAVDAMCRLPHRHVMEAMSQHDHLTDQQVAMLTDRGEVISGRAEWQADIAGDTSGRYNAKVQAALRASAPSACGEV